MALPAPRGELVLEEATAFPPGAALPALKRVGVRVMAGESIGIIGPSGAGKSTLARVALGVWPLAGGSVRLDGAELRQWSREALGPHLGYLPQDVELLDATVAENIARFGDLDPALVVAVALKAGVHELILRLPLGYETPIGEGGAALSGGQRQRVALARALYGSPRLVVLDEPSSNLDDLGEAALIRALAQLKAEGVTVLAISHRPSILNGMDRILVLREGVVDTYAPRDKVIAQFARPTQAIRPASQGEGRLTGPVS